VARPAKIRSPIKSVSIVSNTPATVAGSNPSFGSVVGTKAPLARSCDEHIKEHGHARYQTQGGSAFQHFLTAGNRRS
jgi:hypothetical protein